MHVIVVHAWSMMVLLALNVEYHFYYTDLHLLSDMCSDIHLNDETGMEGLNTGTHIICMYTT